MLGPFNSPLAKHLHAAAVASQRGDGHRLSLGSRDRAGRTPPASVSSIEVGAGARSPGEQLGVSSPTSTAAQRSRLATSSSNAARTPQEPASSAQSSAAQPAPPPPPPPGPAATLHELAVSKQRAAVAAAAAAMQSPAASARHGPLPRWPAAAAAGTPARAALTTPLAQPYSQPATPISAAAAAGTPASAGGSAQPQPRTSFKHQAAQLLHQQQQQQQPTGRRQPLVGPASAAAPSERTSSIGSAQRQAGQRPRPLLYQQQATPPPTSSLEEAMGQLQLQGSLTSAAQPAGTPGLSIRSRGLLTPLSTPRGRPDSAAAARPAAAAATPAPLPAATPQQRAQQAQQPQGAQQQAGEACDPLLGPPLWSPMLPAGSAHAAPLGAGLLGTVRKAPRDGSRAVGGGSPAGGCSGAAAEADHYVAASSAPQGAGLQQEASFGEPADNPAQLRRQLQAIVPELTLTQLPTAAARAAGSADAASGVAAAGRAPQQARPAGVTDREAAEGLLDRMRKLQAAATKLLQEQGAAATCASVAVDFRRLLPGADAAGRSIVATASGGMQTASMEAQQRGRKQASKAGPSAAAAARLAKLAQLRAAGSELAAALA